MKSNSRDKVAASKAVATKSSTAVIPGISEDELAIDINIDQSDVSTDGLDDVAGNTIPLLMLLQSNSPQVTDGDGKVGQWYYTADEKFRDSPVNIIILRTAYTVKKWRSRAEGGGYMGTVAEDDPVLMRAYEERTGRRDKPWGTNKATDDEGQNVEMHCGFDVYGYLFTDEGRVPFVYFVKGNAVKSFRREYVGKSGAVSMKVGTRNVPVPCYLQIWRLGSAKKVNDRKETFYVPTFSRLDDHPTRGIIPRNCALGELLHKEQKELGELLAKGLVVAEQNSLTDADEVYDEPGSHEPEENEGRSKSRNSEKAPF